MAATVGSYFFLWRYFIDTGSNSVLDSWVIKRFYAIKLRLSITLEQNKTRARKGSCKTHNVMQCHRPAEIKFLYEYLSIEAQKMSYHDNIRYLPLIHYLSRFPKNWSVGSFKKIVRCWRCICF